MNDSAKKAESGVQLKPIPESATVNFDEILSEIEIPSSQSIETFNILEERSRGARELENKENGDIIRMRSLWSHSVLTLVIVIVGFDMFLVTFYGLGIWNFYDTKVVTVVIVDNFLKIIGLGYLIASELFKKIFPRQ